MNVGGGAAYNTVPRSLVALVSGAMVGSWFKERSMGYRGR